MLLIFQKDIKLSGKNYIIWFDSYEVYVKSLGH